MSFRYQQTTGILTKDDTVLGIGYSGNTTGLNNPSVQNVRMIGPIPQGWYTIQPPSTHPKLGPIAMALIPDEENEMFGRSGFFMHGDNSDMNHTASDGCTVMGKDIRESVAADVATGYDRLQVVA